MAMAPRLPGYRTYWFCKELKVNSSECMCSSSIPNATTGLWILATGICHHLHQHMRTSSLLGSGRQTLETTLYQYALSTTLYQPRVKLHLHWSIPRQFSSCWSGEDLISPNLRAKKISLLASTCPIQSIMSEDHPLESVGTATAARKRSRAPSSDEDPGRTKLSRRSSSPPAASGISAVSKASEQRDQDVGMAHSTKPPKPLLIHIVNKKIPSSQLAHLKGIARKKDFPLSTTIM